MASLCTVPFFSQRVQILHLLTHQIVPLSNSRSVACVAAPTLSYIPLLPQSAKPCIQPYIAAQIPLFAGLASSIKTTFLLFLINIWKLYDCACLLLSLPSFKNFRPFGGNARHTKAAQGLQKIFILKPMPLHQPTKYPAIPPPHSGMRNLCQASQIL